MMSPDLFLDCILLIINDNSNASRILVVNLINLYETDARNNATVDNDITRFYIGILKTVIETHVSKDNKDALRNVLLKFQSDALLAKRGEIYQLLQETFMSDERMAADTMALYADRIRSVLLMYHCNKVAKTFYGTLARAGDMVNPSDQATELRKLRGLVKDVETAFSGGGAVSQTRPSLVEQIDLSDKESMQAGLQKNTERAVTGVLKLGLQGLNRMLGKAGGLTRGECVVFYALPHHYKSGLLMSVPAWIASYNTPTPNEKEIGKIPLILLISLENEAYRNFIWMYRHFWETLHQQSSDHLTNDEIKEWTYATFNARGYKLIIERHKPAEFNYPRFVETIEYFESLGYYIVLVSVDYVNLMAKDGLAAEAGARNDLAVRALYSAMCNYTKTKGITFASAHPLKREAEALAASGVANAVRRFNKSHIADSFDVAREVDLEIVVHIERNLDGTPYLTMFRWKHRYVDDTPLAHQYCAYPFYPEGIRDDIGGEPGYVTDIYADPKSLERSRKTPNQPAESETETISVF